MRYKGWCALINVCRYNPEQHLIQVTLWPFSVIPLLQRGIRLADCLQALAIGKERKGYEYSTEPRRHSCPWAVGTTEQILVLFKEGPGEQPRSSSEQLIMDSVSEWESRTVEG